MKQFTVRQIGTMEMDKDGMYVKLLPEYILALKSLESFGHADIPGGLTAVTMRKTGAYLRRKAPISRGRIQWAYLQPGPQRPNPIAP